MVTLDALTSVTENTNGAVGEDGGAVVHSYHTTKGVGERNTNRQHTERQAG
jgi:hypothetical protein